MVANKFVTVVAALVALLSAVLPFIGSVNPKAALIGTAIAGVLGAVGKSLTNPVGSKLATVLLAIAAGLLALAGYADLIPANIAVYLSALAAALTSFTQGLLQTEDPDRV